jgi:PAS domain S-box-containing protein
MAAITGAAQDAIVMLTPQGTISFWNPAAERIFGYTHEEAMGQDLHALMAPQRYAPHVQNALPLFCKPDKAGPWAKPWNWMHSARTAAKFPIELSLSALHLPDGWHAVGIMRDITERKRVDRRRCGKTTKRCISRPVLPRHGRPGRDGQHCQKRVPGQHEPRNPHAHERGDRHDRTAAGHGTQ